MENFHKKVIRDQHYEDYWKLTLGVTAYYSNSFIRPLKMIMDHIDQYHLSNKKKDELMKGNYLNQEVTHGKELEAKLSKAFPKKDKTGASTRKLINTFIKLGFVKPYLGGYVPAAKEYIKPNQSKETLQRLFSDTVYEYATFSSSQTVDDTDKNQIKFLVNTLINRKSRMLTGSEMIGLMNMDISSTKGSNTLVYAHEKDIRDNTSWANTIHFEKRKYNQIRYLFNLTSKLNLFSKSEKDGELYICMSEDADKYLPKVNNKVQRDSYRFANMKKAVYDESERIYNEKLCWLTKRKTEGLVVSHIYGSAEALSNWDTDAAYDPNNALLLDPGSPDKYFDKHKFTIDPVNGEIIFSKDVSESFVEESQKNHYHIDKEILNPDRITYIKIHNKEFKEKYKEQS